MSSTTQKSLQGKLFYKKTAFKQIPLTIQPRNTPRSLLPITRLIQESSLPVTQSQEPQHPKLFHSQKLLTKPVYCHHYKEQHETPSNVRCPTLSPHMHNYTKSTFHFHLKKPHNHKPIKQTQPITYTHNFPIPFPQFLVLEKTLQLKHKALISPTLHD